MCSVDIAYLDQGLCGRADNNKYNIARDGSLCRTLRNIKTTSIYFYLFFYLPITGPESPYKTFSNENISSNPIKGLLHIFQTLYPVQFSDQILFLNKFANFVSWNRNCQRITDSSKYIIYVIPSVVWSTRVMFSCTLIIWLCAACPRWPGAGYREPNHQCNGRYLVWNMGHHATSHQ